ncbi:MULTISPECIES: RDD family protein [unclassified Pseudoalteromonas]|uniref:RDD family protein n=1 Tax=unclassified Pseudoalteromonas TaxID=194690 RepID=UPI00237D6B43|nr:RDD family protein [Pseudoalteromonas sp. G4]MDE3272477.1 RDD family protein [Pseudoalteromonas sp. G4]
MSNIEQRTGFMRRLASWVYDALATIAIIMLAQIIFLGLIELLLSLGIVNKTDDADISHFVTTQPWNFINQFYLVCVACFFYVYFWCKGGQTIGMRAWRLKVRNLDGSPISKGQALIRAVTALLGAGNLLVIFDFKNKRALQDYLAKTEVITLSKEENKKVYRELD